MEKIMNVTGMMCPRCEARAQKALEALPEVEKAVADHNANKIVVTLKTPVSDEALKAAVEGAGYQVGEIK